jgi:hypothetical protein
MSIEAINKRARRITALQHAIASQEGQLLMCHRIRDNEVKAMGDLPQLRDEFYEAGIAEYRQRIETLRELLAEVEADVSRETLRVS